MNWQEIKQAKVPIKEFYRNGVVIEGSQIPFRNVRFNESGIGYAGTTESRDLSEAIQSFVRQNDGVEHVYNPFDTDGIVTDKEFLYSAYDVNLALSHWDEIATQYGDKMDSVIVPIVSQEDDGYHGSYAMSMLTLGSQVYYAKSAGLDEDQIDYMIEQADGKSYPDFESVEYVRRCMANGMSLSDMQFFMDNVNPEARQAVGFYEEDCARLEYPVDKNVVAVIGQAREMGEAYGLWSALKWDKISLDEARNILDCNNMIREYAKVDGNNPIINVHTEDGYDFQFHRFMTHDMEGYVSSMVDLKKMYGLNLTDGSLQTFMTDFLENGGTERNMIVYYEQNYQKEAGQKTVDTEVVLGHVYDAMAAAGGNGRTEYHMVSGDNQIDIRASMIEPSWEFFRPGIEIRENGSLLFREDTQNVAPYHNELYHQGRFSTEDDAVAYLKEKYAGVRDWREVTTHAPYRFEEFPIQWSNPDYVAQLQEGEKPLDRVAFKDMGVQRTEDGRQFHKVEFVYACDEKRVGIDKPMRNPYLVSSKNDKNHAVFLSDSLYGVLMKHANTTGLEDSPWSGVIDVRVRESPTKKGKFYVDLTREAERTGLIETPSTPFNGFTHDLFVESSVKNVHKKRERLIGTKLPGDSSFGVDDTQMGE